MVRKFERGLGSFLVRKFERGLGSFLVRKFERGLGSFLFSVTFENEKALVGGVGYELPMRVQR